MSEPFWDVYDIDGKWMGTHFHGKDVREGLAGFLNAIHPDHVEETAAQIGKVVRVQYTEEQVAEAEKSWNQLAEMVKDLKWKVR